MANNIDNKDNNKPVAIATNLKWMSQNVISHTGIQCSLKHQSVFKNGLLTQQGQ